jgi:pyruvate-ferredoxin/flavodoxin oxidoreductase
LFYNRENAPLVIGGRYGLGSKDTTSGQILAVFENLKAENPKDRFTIGINDDVTYTSLEVKEDVNTAPEGTIRCKFWGLGSDGTVGANKTAIKIIGDNTDLYAQGYFAYDSKKSGGVTISHLRFGKNPIQSTYLINEADFIACHNQAYVHQYDVLKGLKDGGTFVLNCKWTPEELEEKLPASMKKYLADHHIAFYIINATDIAQEIGLRNRINMIMQAAFFKLAEVIPLDDAVKYLKEAIVKTYGRKGEKVVKMNQEAVDKGISALTKITIPASWRSVAEEAAVATEAPEFIQKVLIPMNKQEGDSLPVSTFVGAEDGTFPHGTAAYEKRGIAVNVPEWQMDACIQCNQCSFICPHAAIRPILVNEAEAENAPESFKTKKAIGKGLENLAYRMQVSPLDCTGCGNCVDICPAKGKALVMKPLETQTESEVNNWNYAMTVSIKDHLMPTNTVKGSQFAQPLLQFSGACAGCGETPYAKLITQLFGDRMMVANATGCSSIWGASAPTTPYCKNAEGKGPAWANSLFEDNAEYGYGMAIAIKQIRNKIVDLINELLTLDISEEIKVPFKEWLKGKDDAETSKIATEKIISTLTSDVENIRAKEIFAQIQENKDYLIKKSIWILGGDGWAYDIGFGGLDHVLASGEDVNVLVFDTEVYSNTGGQSSKATPTAAVAKFAASGKRVKKKDLGMIAASYGYVYVAQVGMGADKNQLIKALIEAEKYDGPSLIIAYAPCINHGIKEGMGRAQANIKQAVDAGYWQLYRYNPALKEEGKNPLTLDSKEPVASFQDFIKGQVRYTSLMSQFPEIAGELFAKAEKEAKEKYETYKNMAK